MPRRTAAYLADIVDACEAIADALRGQDLASYENNRLVRSAVEREFILVGEAMTALSHHEPDTFSSISDARRIVDFRNLLTHEYATIDDALVYAVAVGLAPALQAECMALLATMTQGEDGLD